MERYGMGSRYEGFGARTGMLPYGFPYESPYGYEPMRSYGGERWFPPYRREGEEAGAYAEWRSGWERQHGQPVHTWRGGVLGWIGSGVRAAAAWSGLQMQRWGGLLGGKLTGGAEQMGESLRGGGERVGSALEESGVEGLRGYRRSRAGRIPSSYRRPDDRVLDDVYERIARSGADAGDVEIEVSDGTVTLSGDVPTKFDKRLIEELADDVFGVREVHNHLKLARRIEEKGIEAGEQPGRHDGHERRQPEPPRPQA